MKIFNPNGSILYYDLVGDGSYCQQELMGQHNVTIYITSAVPIEFKVGCYLDFQGVRYKIRKKNDIKEQAIRNLEYTVIFESPQADAEKRTIRHPSDNRLKFPYNGYPREHAQLIVDNLNKIGEGGWKVGECIETERITVNYNHTKCLEGVKMLADALKTEWEFDNKTLHIRKVEYNKDSPLLLRYGYNGGLKPGITRTNVDNSSVPIEILAVQGGTRNIDSSRYNNTELLLPKGQKIKFDGANFEDESGFDEANSHEYIVDADGLTLQRADRTLLTYEDGSTDLSNIYPHRVGEVTGIEVTKDSFYNIIDTTIPENLNYSKYRINGEKMTVKFETGMLAGREFDIVQTDKALSGYNHAKRTFMLVSQEYDGQTMPNKTFAPKVGDKYAVFGMWMPDEYIRDDASKSGASWDMFREAVRIMYEEEQDKFEFTGEIDGIWAKRNWVNVGGKLVMGGYVRFCNDVMIDTVEGVRDSVLIRITVLKNFINNPCKPIVTLANTTAATWNEDFRQIPQNDVKAEAGNRETLNFTKRGFRQANETLRMLQDSLLNFSDGISPITVQTMQLLAGDENLQFRFVTDKVNQQQDLSFSIGFDTEHKRLKVSKGILQHMTIGIDSISSSHKATDYRYWDMEAYTSAVLDIPTKRYYLYAKVSKSDQLGTFLLSETAISIEQVAGYYHFLVGILNSENDGDRSFAPLYGFTEILPGRITTDKIVSSDGNNIIDLKNNAMRLGDNTHYIAWNIMKGLLEIMNATLEIKNENGEIVAKIDGNSGASSFGKGNIILNADGSASFGNRNVILNADGSTSFSAGKNILNADGSGSLANGNIKFDKEGNVDFIGGIASGTKGGRFVVEREAGLLKLYDKFNRVAGMWWYGDGSDERDPQSFITLGNGFTFTGTYIAYQQEGKSHFNLTPTSFVIFNWKTEAFFFVDINDDSGYLQLIARGLPTNSYGLKRGQIWRDGSTLKIVP